MIFQLRCRKVADVAVELAAAERVEHRRFIDDAAAGEVHDDAAVAHQAQARGVDEIARSVEQRHVHGDHVGARKQIVERQRLLDPGRQLPRALHGDLRIEAEHAHAEQVRCIRDLDADRAEPDHAERAARQLVADELLLALLDRLVQLLVVALEPTHVLPRLADVARGEEQPGNDELLDRVRIRAGRVEDGNAALGKPRDRNVVGAGAGARDRFDARRHIHLVHVRGAQQDRIGMTDLGGDLVALARQAFQPAHRDVVEGEDPESFLSHAASRRCA